MKNKNETRYIGTLIIIYNLVLKWPSNDCSPVERTVDDIIWRYHTEAEATLKKLRRSDSVCTAACMKKGHNANWNGFLVMTDDPHGEALSICVEAGKQTCMSG
ncbi:hypothetical protein E3Q13_01501 [Wallemia mellicola]|nr:hypothetical protein E3Q13_01501 [Wallemia mellicola]